MNNLERDLRTTLTLQAEAMEVPPMSTPVGSVGRIHADRTAPGLRWMLAAAAVVLVIGGGLAVADLQPDSPSTASTIDGTGDLPAAPGTNTSPDTSPDDTPDTSPGTSPVTSGDPTGTNDAGASDTGDTGTGTRPASGSNSGTGATKAPPPSTKPEHNGDGEGSAGGGGAAPLPPICDDQDTSVKLGASTDMLLGTVGSTNTIEFFLYGCEPIQPEGYDFSASVADPEMVTIVTSSAGTVVLQFVAEGITSVKMFVTDAAGNPVASVVVPIDVRSSSPDPGDTPDDPGANPGDPGADPGDPGDPSDPGDIICLVPVPGTGDDASLDGRWPDGTVIGYEPCGPSIIDPDRPYEPKAGESGTEVAVAG